MLQRLKALAGVVEVRNGFRQARPGQIFQEILEPAESAPRLKRLLRRLHRFKRFNALDKHKRPPALAGAVAVKRLAFARGHDGQTSPRNVARAAVFEFSPQMAGDALDI